MIDIRFKGGVKLQGMRPEVILACSVSMIVCAKLGFPWTMTSGIEGSHSHTSLHYSGCAFDLRTRNVPDPKLLSDSIREALTTDFDVILERTHIHIEYQPRQIT